MTLSSELDIPKEQISNPEQIKDILPSLGAELSRYNMFCLHGIALDDVGNNSRLAEDTTLEERFRIAIEEKPALSAVVHTDRATTSKASLWGNIGVVIGEGGLQAASAKDMSTVMLDDGNRQTLEQSPSDTFAAIDQIAVNDAKYSEYPLHNEVVVKDPVIKAVYFKDTAGLMPHEINRAQTTAEPGVVPKLIRDVAEKFGLPVFAVRTSGMFRVDGFDGDTGKYRFSLDGTPRVRPGEVLSHPHAKPETFARLGDMASHSVVALGKSPI